MEDIVFVVKPLQTSEKKVMELPDAILPQVGVKDGGFVSVSSTHRSTIVKVLSTQDSNFKTRGGVITCIVGMDSYTMKLLKLAEGDRILVKPANVQTAQEVVLTPNKRIAPEDVSVIHRVLDGKPLALGDVIPIMLPSGKTIFTVKEVSPSSDGVLVSHDVTRISITHPVKKRGDFIIDVTFEDIGGYEDVKEKVHSLIITPILHPEAYKNTGFKPPKGIIISGPSGSGKTMLIKAIVFETDANLIYAHASDIMSDSYSESKSALEDLFEDAKGHAPSLLCIEDIDLIAPRRTEETMDVERKLTSVLISLMDKLDKPGVVVIGTTSNMDRIDPALRRAGRFDREIELPVPDVNLRKDILKTLTRNLPLMVEFTPSSIKTALEFLSPEMRKRAELMLERISIVMRADEIEEMIKSHDPELYQALHEVLLDTMLGRIAKKTHGFVGADLEALVREAIMTAINRLTRAGFVNDDGTLSHEGIEHLMIAEVDFNEARKHVDASALKEILIEVPEIHWDGIGGYEEVKKLLQEVVEWPLSRPQLFEATGISPPKGVLLYGPPGTGKTLLSKAVATESGANFIAVKGPEVLSKWVGEGERKIREIFRKARQVAPTIIFFDEIDSIGQRRGIDKAQHVDSMINQLLTEMDGLEERGKVVVIAATNRPDILDPALLRPGRFDRLILVPAPDEKARLEILKVHTREVPLSSDVDLKAIARNAEGYSGADLEALVREATMNAIRRAIKDIPNTARTEEIREKVKVTMEDFKKAAKKVKASISKEMMSYYERMERNLKTSVSSKFTDDYGRFW